MGILFDENASNRLDVTDATALSLPDSDWCICLWESTTDNTGSLFQYMISGGTFGASNSFQIYFNEASAAGLPNTLTVRFHGSGGGQWFESGYSSGTLTFNGTPRLWVVQRSGSNVQIHSCTIGGSVTTHVNVAGTSLDALNPPGMRIGGRQDGNADRAYGGTLGHIWKGDFALSTSEIQALASGSSIYDLGRTPSYYLHLLANVASPPDLTQTVTTTRAGTLADGIEFPVFQDNVVYVNFTPAAGGGGNSIDPNGVTSNWNGLSSYNWNGVA